MKTLVVTMMVVMGLPGLALADGFVCKEVDGKLQVKVFNHVQPEDGTRNAAVMVISDSAIQLGRKTIARFTDLKETLTNHAARYVADVDLRFTDSSRKGELIGGTKLGQLDSIILDVDFSYVRPMEAGEETLGLLTLVKRNGGQIAIDLECTRYLKN